MKKLSHFDQLLYLNYVNNTSVFTTFWYHNKCYSLKYKIFETLKPRIQLNKSFWNLFYSSKSIYFAHLHSYMVEVCTWTFETPCIPNYVLNQVV